MELFKFALQKEGIGVSIVCSVTLQLTLSSNVFIAVESNDDQIKETELHYIHKGIAKVWATITNPQLSYTLSIENCQWDLVDYNAAFWELAIAAFLCKKFNQPMPAYNLFINHQANGEKLSFEWM